MVNYSELSTSELLKLKTIKEAEVTRFNNMQMARKIAINAAYGAISNNWFIFFSLELSEAITYSGQLVIKYVSIKLNEYLNNIFKTDNIDYVVAGDTDSVALTFDRLVKIVMPDETDSRKITKFLVKVIQEKLNPFLSKIFTELKDYTNAYEQKLNMKTESISETGIWKAKKRYALNVWWDEGVFYETPKLKIRGIEAVSSTTPEICRNAIKKSLTLLLTDKKDELYSFVKEFEKQFRSSSFEEIASTSGITDINKYFNIGQPYYIKGTPIHVRAALLYNFYIHKFKIDDVFQRISNGDKIKYCYMKMPNPIGENVVGVYNRLPKEFGMEKYIDYDKQFETEFLKPVNSIATIIGWDIKNQESILDFLV